MTKLILDDEAAQFVREKALQKGYSDPTAYILDLVAADDGLDEVAENEQIRNDLKLAFQQAIQGKTISREELKHRMLISKA